MSIATRFQFRRPTARVGTDSYWFVGVRPPPAGIFRVRSIPVKLAPMIERSSLLTGAEARATKMIGAGRLFLWLPGSSSLATVQQALAPTFGLEPFRGRCLVVNL